MKNLSVRHPGGTVTLGSALSGTRYVSHTTHAPNTTCWMKLAVFTKFPTVPSLAGTQVQGRQDLLASTVGAGTPEEGNLLLQIELFDDECPQLCANFRRLCGGRSSTRQDQVYCFQGLIPSYCGTYFHKIIPSYCAQGGDITMRVKPGGTNAYSSAGRIWLQDEFKKRRHNEIGLVSMANNGPNSNGSQFFITTSAGNERAFNGRHCCIGRVVRGLDAFMTLVAPFGNVDGHPSKYAVIVDCGEGEPSMMMSSLSSADIAPQASTVTSDREDAPVPAAAEVCPMPADETPEQPTVSFPNHPTADSTDVMADATTQVTGETPEASSICSTRMLKSSLKKTSDPAAKTHTKHVSYKL